MSSDRVFTRAARPWQAVGSARLASPFAACPTREPATCRYMLGKDMPTPAGSGDRRPGWSRLEHESARDVRSQCCVILMDSVAVAVWLKPSVTCTVKVKVPTFVGVPLIVPLGLRLRTGGSAPETTFQEYGVVPFAAWSTVVGYRTFLRSLGRLVVVTTSACVAALTVKVKLCVAFEPTPLAAVMLIG